jgi:hypothetical protein
VATPPVLISLLSRSHRSNLDSCTLASRQGRDLDATAGKKTIRLYEHSVDSLAGKCLKGRIDLATKFEFIINLQTAKSLRLDISPTLLARADEVIE